MKDFYFKQIMFFWTQIIVKKKFKTGVITIESSETTEVHSKIYYNRKPLYYIIIIFHITVFTVFLIE